jgi:hypothetical protein
LGDDRFRRGIDFRHRAVKAVGNQNAGAADDQVGGAVTDVLGVERLARGGVYLVDGAGLVELTIQIAPAP